MKIRPANLFWLLLLIFVAGGFIYALIPPRPDTHGRKLLADTRQSLRDQGFKTDLADFDFSTNPEMRAREQILKATGAGAGSLSFANYPDLMEKIGTNAALVVWNQDTLKRTQYSRPGDGDSLTWDEFRAGLDENRAAVDAACEVVLSGPIAFNLESKGGYAMLLPHLAMLKHLTQILGSRMVLALHDGEPDAAFTNLLAETRLTTAWNPEPAEFSHLWRFGNVTLAYQATWQAMQTNHWSDEQLARLQREWESASFFTNLAEVVAFQRACALAAYEQEPEVPPQPPMSFGDFLDNHLINPYEAWNQFQYQWRQRDYLNGGKYRDSSNAMLFYRDREIERRKALQAATWQQMRRLSGVTNESVFDSKFHWQVQMMEGTRRYGRAFQLQGSSFLGRAAEVEAKRRILITALALERYRNRHGFYPPTLPSLAPEFLTSIPADFMDGQPLRYRLMPDGHFILYSVGQDCVDDGGKFPARPKGVQDWQVNTGSIRLLGTDILWPLPASSAQVAVQRAQQSLAEAEHKAQMEANDQARLKEVEVRAEESRQAAMKKLLATKTSLGPEPMYQGKPLSVWVIKAGQIEELHGAPEDAIAAIRAIGPKAVPFLLEWMPHPGAEQPVEGFPDWSDVEIAFWALGTNGEAAIPELARILNRPQKTMNDYSGWTESAKAISHLGPKAIIPMLTVATNMQGKHDLWELLHNFENLGTNGAPAVPALISWANDTDSWVRDGVVSALGGIGKRPDLAVPVLTNALHDSDSMVRRDAATALGSFANDSDAVLPLLISTVTNSIDWEARGGALSGLGKIQNKPEIVVPVIVPYLYDNNNVIQRTAAYALRDLGSEAGYRALLQASNAPSSWPGIGDIIYEVQEKMSHSR